jgi:hypothetical protein
MYKPSKLLYTNLPRKQVTTTINTELYKEFQTLSIQIDQPTSKMFDVLLMNLFDGDETKLNDFIYQVKLYSDENNNIKKGW